MRQKCLWCGAERDTDKVITGKGSWEDTLQEMKERLGPESCIAGDGDGHVWIAQKEATNEPV